MNSNQSLSFVERAVVSALTLAILGSVGLIFVGGFFSVEWLVFGVVLTSAMVIGLMGYIYAPREITPKEGVLPSSHSPEMNSGRAA